MTLSIIIVNYNVKYFIEVCLHSVLRACAGIDAEVIVVDNNSRDGSCAMIQSKYPGVKLLENKENLGFSKANNQGVAMSRGKYILFVNPDTVMPEDFLHKCISYMDAHPEAGAIGPRLIDGRGLYAPDGKKSFPSLSVAIFKTTGINKIFKNSAYFNKYYAVHVGEHETAEVDILSGCCMMVRHDVIRQVGGAFDEAYFMYCEDFDLCYRIQKAGYKNIYYPEVTLVHYKGESTRKATLSHVRTFNDALTVFVRKHYTRTNAGLFIMLINIGIVFRAVWGVLKQVLKVLRMPIFDSLILLVILIFMKEFWVEHVKNILPIPLDSILKTFPVYIGLWVLSMYFNGTYDQSYRAVRVVRGMAVGTVAILAYYGLLPPELRYSRAIIIFTAFIGTVAMLGLHGLLHRLGIFRFIPYDELTGKAVIVADAEHYAATAATLEKVNYAPDVTGRIEPGTNKSDALATLDELKPFLYTASVQEVIFSINGLSYAETLRRMQECGGDYEYKIHIPGSNSFVGSNSSHTAGDLYTLDKKYNLSDFGKQRSKRLFDLLAAIVLILLSPVAVFTVKRPAAFFGNIFSVLAGRRTWIGYSMATQALPQTRRGILPPYNVLGDYEPDAHIREKLDIQYAEDYHTSTDLKLLLKNFKYLGGFQ